MVGALYFTVACGIGFLEGFGVLLEPPLELNKLLKLKVKGVQKVRGQVQPYYLRGQSGSDWPQMGQIQDFFRADISIFFWLTAI